MARWSQARWNPVPTCGPGSLNPIAVTLHHQAGNGDPAPIYISRNVSAHFWIPKSGQPVQHVDTNVRAWHGGTEGLNGNCIGVETEGCGAPPHAEPLTNNQLDWFAALMDWANFTHGIPIRLSEEATTPGLNYHRCTGGFATACPCDVRVNARAEIIKRATAVPPVPSDETYISGQGEEMAIAVHPNGVRLDLVVVGTNRVVYHYWSANGDLRNRQSENLGGEAKFVTATWSKNTLTVVAHGTNNKPYVKVHDGKKWGDWFVLGDMALYDPCT